MWSRAMFANNGEITPPYAKQVTMQSKQLKYLAIKDTNLFFFA